MFLNWDELREQMLKAASDKLNEFGYSQDVNRAVLTNMKTIFDEIRAIHREYEGELLDEDKARAKLGAQRKRATDMMLVGSELSFFKVKKVVNAGLEAINPQFKEVSGFDLLAE